MWRHLAPPTSLRLCRRRCCCAGDGVELLGAAVLQHDDHRVFKACLRLHLHVVLDRSQQSKRVGPFCRFTPDVDHAAIVVVGVHQRSLLLIRSPADSRAVYSDITKTILQDQDNNTIVVYDSDVDDTKPSRLRRRLRPKFCFRAQSGLRTLNIAAKTKPR